jgi:hypothetical protein
MRSSPLLPMRGRSQVDHRGRSARIASRVSFDRKKVNVREQCIGRSFDFHKFIWIILAGWIHFQFAEQRGVLFGDIHVDQRHERARRIIRGIRCRRDVMLDWQNARRRADHIIRKSANDHIFAAVVVKLKVRELPKVAPPSVLICS